jgi:methylmalonyl-CoA carboxyltransferase 1.3S subunit
VKLTVTVNGTPYNVEVEVEPEPLPTLSGFSAKLAQSLHPPTHVRAAAAEHKVLRATISGTVTRVLVSAGEEVEAGATLLMLEAMKMESEITAPAPGTIGEVNVTEGEAVAGGQVLVTWK